MFRRVIIEGWHEYLPLIGFALTFAVFLVMLLRALLMRRERCYVLARLPLEEPATSTTPTPPPLPAKPACNGQCAGCRCTRD